MLALVVVIDLGKRLTVGGDLQLTPAARPLRPAVEAPMRLGGARTAPTAKSCPRGAIFQFPDDGFFGNARGRPGSAGCRAERKIPLEVVEQLELEGASSRAIRKPIRTALAKKMPDGACAMTRQSV